MGHPKLPAVLLRLAYQRRDQIIKNLLKSASDHMALEDDDILSSNNILGIRLSIKKGDDAWEIASSTVTHLVGWNKDNLKELEFKTDYRKDGPYSYPEAPHRIIITIIHSVYSGDRTDQFNFSRNEFIRIWNNEEKLLNKISA